MVYIYISLDVPLPVRNERRSCIAMGVGPFAWLYLSSHLIYNMCVGIHAYIHTSGEPRPEPRTRLAVCGVTKCALRTHSAWQARLLGGLATCRVMFARAPVLGLCFFASVNRR